MEELLYSLIQLAIEHKASDIHFIVKQDHMDIQFRNDLGMEKIEQDIWDKGDEEILEYLKEKDPIERKKLREKYTPIGPLGIGRPDWNRSDWKKKRKQK